MKSPYEIIDDPEPINPMTKEDKLKLANFFWHISTKILACAWPPEELPYIRSRVQSFMRTAYRLEAEAYD